MKKHLNKFIAENFSRSSKSDCRDFELETIEKQVDKYRDVLDKMVRKLPTVTNSNTSGSVDIQERDKRIKKKSHYKIGLAMEESSKELSKDMPLQNVLLSCGELEKSIALCIVESELQTESKVVGDLKAILDGELTEILTLKRNVSRTLQDYTSTKKNYETAVRYEDSQPKINNLKEQLEQYENKLEKDRDLCVADMFKLIAKEDKIIDCIRDYVLIQRNYHERALKKVNTSLTFIQDIIQSTVKSRFDTMLNDHLNSTNRKIAYIIELCVCCLIEHGLNEEGLLRVGCPFSKLNRMKHALEAQFIKTPLPIDYQDPHVIGAVLKSYLRDLPEPLLTFDAYIDFMGSIEKDTEEERKAEIKKLLGKLPYSYYLNTRYLMKFLWLITQNQNSNKMTPRNLAVVIAPNILRPVDDKNKPADIAGQVNDSAAGTAIVTLLIREWDYFFEGEVEFFITLQRGKLFVDKNKTNSSNENLELNESEVAESPRYGTIRRQKACAPSPPTKLQSIVSTDPSGSPGAENTLLHRSHGEAQHSSYQKGAKELFPTTSGAVGGSPNNSNNNNNSNTSSSGHTERPEIPPPPKQLLLQQQQQQQQTQSETATTTNKAQPPPIAAKPPISARTQFFLDNSPSSSTADRKSSDSVGYSNIKPDIPQKPSALKRGMTLGLNTTLTTSASATVAGENKSDEESTPTNITQQNIIDNTINVSLRGNKTAGQLVQQHCDNVSAWQANIGSSNTSIPTSILRETNHNQILSQTTTNQSNLEVNANAVPNPPALPPNPPVTVAKVRTSSTAATVTTSSTASSLTTPTTPVSPQTILTPRRPTEPAPPPPTSAKKQSE